MFRSTTQMTGLAIAALIAMSAHGFAEIEHIGLQEPCNGKSGRAIVSYSWSGGAEIETEHVFSDVCVDLDAMRINSVEMSEELIPKYITPTRNTYRVYLPDYHQVVEEVVVLSTDMIMQPGDGDQQETDPEAPEALTEIGWHKSGNTRPLNRRDRGSAWMRGYVGGEPLEGSPKPGSYSGIVSHMLYRGGVASELSGLGFHMEATMATTELGAEVDMKTHVMQAIVQQANASLSLDFVGDEISGTGTFEAENSVLSPVTDKVWKRFDLESAGVTGRLMGEDGNQIYLLVVWEGTYTDFADMSYPLESVMTVNAARQD